MSRVRSLCLLGGALALALLASPAAGLPGQDKPPEKADRAKAQNDRDFKALQGVFGKAPVSITYATSSASVSSVEGVRITGLVVIFGKQYLRADKNGGKQVLIRAETITSIKED